MKIRSTSLAMAAMMSAGFLAAPINVLAKAPEMPQGIYAQPFADGEQAAAKEKHYDLDWKLKRADSPGNKSMAQDHIEKITAVEKDGKWTFTISIKPESSQFIGKFYYYKDGTKSETQQKGNDWSFTLDSKPENPIKLAFAITVMEGKEKEAFLEISKYKEIKGEASQEPETPGQKPKEETALEKAKKALDEAVKKANGEDKNGWDGDVAMALNATASAADALLQDASAKEEDLTLKVSELNFLLALGEKTKGMDDTAKKVYEGFLTVASELKDTKLADKGALKKNLDENAALLKATDKKDEDLKKAGEAFALFMGNSKPADKMDIGNLKALIDQKKKVDPSSYTEKSQKELKDLLQTAEKEIEGDKLTKGRVRELEAAIYSWHGELKQKEVPKDENKDKPKDENPLDKKDEKKKGQTLRYELPVALTKVGGGKSMASSALSSSATVDVYNGRYTYYVQFKPMKMNNMEGRLTNLFYYDGGKRRASYHGDGLWSFTLNDKVQSQKIALWVDVMDKIQGGPGKGEQDAYLQFDWNSARETRRIDGEVKTPEKQVEEQKTEDKKKEEQKSAEEKKKEALKAKSETERNAVLTQFKDIGADHWALNAIAHSVARGYFKGEGEGRFAPNRAITRAEFVTILGRKAGITPSGASTAFKDVKGDAYYAPYVAWAASAGMIQGTGGGKFEPNRTITREEMAVILDKFLSHEKKAYASAAKGQFHDGTKISSWAKDSVEKMTRQGLLNGMGNGNFAPKESFSRAQAAQVLYTIDTKDMK
ncbi:S-layer homology domain-containing protein [Peptoniphilus sp. EMRHCC_23]|uniref:S-layer homology domain-containing protein n=1 Tax=Peptoniphilus rachelemmaiella TaxID=2811779 RepID=UPI001C000B53|nr:S-layer homology domain-containing protein [Peptoniphilus rachelemmaiella]